MTVRETERPAFVGVARTSRRSLALAAVGVAALAVALRFAAAVAVNAPAGPSTLPVELIGPATTGIAALAALGLGVSEDDPVVGVGLLFVGVFGALAVAVELAVPAAVAVVAGTAVVHVGTDARSPATVLPATLLVGALAVSLAGGLGWASLRPVGSSLSLLAVAATPLFAAADARAFVVGAAAFAAVAAFGLASPFVTGAVTLVGGGVVGTSLPVVALAVFGAVTTASAALRRRRWALLFGVALVAGAGVPATLARAVPFALGVATLLTLEVDR